MGQDEFYREKSHPEEICFPDSASPLTSTDVIEPFRGDTIDNKMEAYKGLVQEVPRVRNTLFGFTLNDNRINAISGALAGLLSGIVVCPLDVAKTRLQAQGLQTRTTENLYYRGSIGTMTTIVRDEGVRGLYKGLVPIIMGYFPTWMIYFSVYEFCKDNLRTNSSNWSFVSHSFSAITAGAVSTVVTNPIWVVKTRLMLQTHIGSNTTHYQGTYDAFKKIINQEGVKALYAGLVPSLLGLLHVAIHFPVYERLKVSFKCYQRDESSNESKINLKRLILASSVSKMVASVLSYPHEILRTRLQLKSDLPSHHRRLIPLIKITYIQEGIFGFYSGFGTNLFRTLPASAITLVSFEYVRNFLNKI